MACAACSCLFVFIPLTIITKQQQPSNFVSLFTKRLNCLFVIVEALFSLTGSELGVSADGESSNASRVRLYTRITDR